jgi:hypothetical protein
VATTAGEAANVYLTLATSVTPTAVGAKCTASLAQDILNAERVGSGLKADAAHRAASFLTQQELEAGRAFVFTGNDGFQRVLLQTEGPALNGEKGIYEYILILQGK